jgi:hypothetical protein
MQQLLPMVEHQPDIRAPHETVAAVETALATRNRHIDTAAHLRRRSVTSVAL